MRPKDNNRQQMDEKDEEYTFDNAVALFAWLVFGIFIGCQWLFILLADIFTSMAHLVDLRVIGLV